MNQQQARAAVEEFEGIIEMAEIRALSNISLKRPLSDKEYTRMMELKEKLFEG